MARRQIQDLYQNFRFHVFDLTPSDSLKGLAIPFVALSPQLGFRTCSAPGMTANIERVKPGNRPLSVPHVKDMVTEPVILTRGVYTGDQEFFNWIQNALWGRGVYRRRIAIMQIHNFGYGQFLNGLADRAGIQGSSVSSAAEFAGLAALASLTLASSKSPAAGVAGDVATSVTSLAGGPSLFARMWVLHGCVPTKYKAASDFDASDDGISLTEFELEYEFFEEFSTGPPPITQGWT